MAISIVLNDTDPFDTDAAANWIQSTIDADMAETNELYGAAFEAESRLAEEMEHRARQEGSHPEGPHTDSLMEIHNRMSETLDLQNQMEPVTLEHLRDWGVMTLPLPAGVSYVKRPAYSAEAEEQKDQGTGMSFADRGSGRMRLRFETGGLTDWEWARCSLGQTFTARKDNPALSPTFDFRLVSDFVTAWGFFCNADVELDIDIHTFNVTQNKNWRRRRQIGRVVNTWIGMVGQTFRLRPLFSESGVGEANAGDTLIVTATLTGRAKSPTGRAGMNVNLDLLRISIAGV
ncbi:hypothetical protein K1W69_10915 [Hoeflea sp. WL0058]|uniref:Uncharacterized protein n=1 Tax=Flavimaribacter sediminis TaxID=2865987 RepID=A0AAE2ZJL6_9HYPH|nr:hypothetical protein [Flavimaribacter sediminis]MBW8637698.1 hypothetical protein [Flavimaribacter sediminis]